MEDIVKLEEYNKKWKLIFEQEKEKLQQVFSNTNLDIVHVGSTSIEGMIAKPVIDILVGVGGSPDSYIDKICHIGYVFCQEDAVGGRLYFQKRKDTNCNIMLVEKGKDVWNKVLFFKEKLQQSKKLREEYSVLKAFIVNSGKTNLKEYSNAKFDFINKVLKEITK